MMYSICKKCNQEVEIFEINKKQICMDCELEIKSLTFWERYNMWEQQVFNEFVECEFYNGDEITDIEICEDGTIYYNDLLNYVKDIGTPWKESIYYTEESDEY